MYSRPARRVYLCSHPEAQTPAVNAAVARAGRERRSRQKLPFLHGFFQTILYLPALGDVLDGQEMIVPFPTFFESVGIQKHVRLPMPAKLCSTS